jgi:3-methyl-2-oxobutanoate hydroxymethyltransferase
MEQKSELHCWVWYTIFLMPKITIADVQQMKRDGQKIITMTAYDYELARIVERAGAEIILVGDSGARHALGCDDMSVTVDEMLLLTRSVARAAKQALVIGDMPFMSYQVSHEEAIRNAGRFLKEAGAGGVKIEGGEDFAPMIRAVVQAGIPVMGHMGLTPQTALAFGGNYRSESATVADDQVRRDAFALQEAGVFSIVLTRVPPKLAEELTKELRVPTLAGGGAGDACDGPVCVMHGVLGLRVEELDTPRAEYGPLAVPIYEAAKKFCDDVRAGKAVRGSR